MAPAALDDDYGECGVDAAEGHRDAVALLDALQGQGAGVQGRLWVASHGQVERYHHWKQVLQGGVPRRGEGRSVVATVSNFVQERKL